jgi:transposase
VAGSTTGRGSGDGINRPILETSLGSIGTVLETDLRDARKRKAAVWNTASGTGAVEPRPHEDQVKRLAEVPGLSVDSAQQIIAEVGATASTFPSERHLSSWVGVCPGDEESAEVNYSRRSPQGNRHMRRILNQAANAAVKHKGSIFQILYRRYVPRMGQNQTIGIIAHKLCRLIWKILHLGAHYQEQGPQVNKTCKQKRTQRMIRNLRKLGYRVELTSESVPPA